MANSLSPAAVTVAVRKPINHRFLVMAAAPILLLVLAMAALRFLPNEEADPEARPRLRRVRLPSRPFTPGPPLSEKSRRAIRDVVQGQLDAFRRNDYAAALRFSASDFRATTSPEQFRDLIRARYTPLSTNVRVYVRPPRSTPNGANLLVIVQDKQGNQSGFFYQVIRERENWQIAGCAPAPLYDLEPPERRRRNGFAPSPTDSQYRLH
ncbi:MAG: DUF4864 domain-containing protein [Capsulimonadales bacterium]|nr:DUF4864 domain-containing protein [Capsulimonadales bacterium]